MRKSVAIAVVLFFSLAAVGWAGDNMEEKFFRTCIEQRISKCEKKFFLVNSKGENARMLGQRARSEAAFLRENGEKLVKEMVQRDIDENAFDVEQFLIERFVEQTEFARN